MASKIKIPKLTHSNFLERHSTAANGADDFDFVVFVQDLLIEPAARNDYRVEFHGQPFFVQIQLLQELRHRGVGLALVRFAVELDVDFFLWIHVVRDMAVIVDMNERQALEYTPRAGVVQW